MEAWRGKASRPNKHTKSPGRFKIMNNSFDFTIDKKEGGVKRETGKISILQVALKND
jgi:hypothetical protein